MTIAVAQLTTEGGGNSSFQVSLPNPPAAGSIVAVLAFTRGNGLSVTGVGGTIDLITEDTLDPIISNEYGLWESIDGPQTVNVVASFN